MITSTLHILLVEDNEDDIFIFRRACRKIGIDHPIHVVRDGVAVVDYLQGKGSFADRGKFPLPQLVFLDLKLPLQSGASVLSWIRAQLTLAKLPVVVLTSSGELRDIGKMKSLHANAYLVKPPKRQALRQVFRELETAGLVPPRFNLDGDRFTTAGLP